MWIDTTEKSDSSSNANFEDLDFFFKAPLIENSVSPNHVGFDEYQDHLRNIDEVVNNKISVGMKKFMQIIIKKIVALIEEKVKERVGQDLEAHYDKYKDKDLAFDKRIKALELALKENEKHA